MRKMKKLLVILVFSALVFGIVLGIGGQELYNEEQESLALSAVAGSGVYSCIAGVSLIPPREPEPEEVILPTLRLVMIGDMLMHPSVYNSGWKEDGSYEYSHLFSKIEGTLYAADLAIVNQETILGGTEMGLSGYPTFNSPQELGDSEVQAGFDIILHATNHTLDQGGEGVHRTLQFWDEKHPDIKYLGIHRDQESQDQIYIHEYQGMKIAILNYTYGTNGLTTPKDEPFLVDYLEKERVIRDLKAAEELADFTIVCPHWGTEYYLGTNSYQQNWVQIFLENGVDLVIGTHPHVIEPMEWVSDEEGHKMLVYYSLGNYVTATAEAENVGRRMVGGMADVTIGYGEDGKLEIREYTVHPLVCHKADGTDYTTYFLKDYTQELASQNHVLMVDAAFSLQYCRDLVTEVWGEEYLDQ